MTALRPNEQQPYFHGYPPLSDYGFISECHSMALVSMHGSIDWCVMPRVDANSVFGRILDWRRGGYCEICPDLDAAEYECTRRYVGHTLILDTTFKTDRGEARLYDCFAMRTGGRTRPLNQLIRIIEGVDGKVPIRVTISPRFDYGLLTPWMQRRNSGDVITAIGGHQGLLFSGNIEFEDPKDAIGRAFFSAEKGQRHYLAITYYPPQELDVDNLQIPDINELERRFQDTIGWWENWSSQATYHGSRKKQTLTSAIVLKGLTNAPTGAIAAAATTSLPESIGGSRNWDYRFSWVRDSVLSVNSLGTLGFYKEADGFRRFIERAAAGDASELQVMFGVGGERYLFEHEVNGMEGYRGSAPVRIGNAAADQLQLDVFGNLLLLAYKRHTWGNSPNDDYWDFILRIIERTGDIWHKPDHGIWEIRGEPRHYVQSKVMCWVAFDLAIRLAQETGRKAPLDKWEAKRDEIRSLIEEHGFDQKRGVYTQAFTSPYMDASLLLLPVFGYIPYDDERTIRTTDMIRKELVHDGLTLRYPSGVDGLEGNEGTFICCTFWLAEVLARQNRFDEAIKAYDAACATANDLGLFSEEFDVRKQLMLGNFPQALSHLSMISAAIAIDDGASEKGNPTRTARGQRIDQSSGETE